MSAPHVTAEDVGTYWTRDDGSVWRLVGYCVLPTATWERIDGDPIERPPSRECRCGAVGSLVTEGFVRLVRENASQQDLERAEAALRKAAASVEVIEQGWRETLPRDVTTGLRSVAERARAALGEQPA